MNTPTSASGDGLGSVPRDFSLVLGGPLFQLLRKAHLSDDALTMVRQRITVIALIAWLPLLVLSALQGQMLRGSAAVPFLLDVELHIRFLVALPLLIIAELIVHRRMRPLLQQFLNRNLIPENAMPRFEAAVASAFRLRNSVLAEVLLIAFVYGVGILIIWRQYLALDTATWYATPSAEGSLGSATVTGGGAASGPPELIGPSGLPVTGEEASPLYGPPELVGPTGAPVSPPTEPPGLFDRIANWWDTSSTGDKLKAGGTLLSAVGGAKSAATSTPSPGNTTTIRPGTTGQPRGGAQELGQLVQAMLQRRNQYLNARLSGQPIVPSPGGLFGL